MTGFFVMYIILDRSCSTDLSVPLRGNDLSKVKTHFTTQTLRLCDVPVVSLRMWYHLHTLRWLHLKERGKKDGKHLPFFLSKGDYQNMEQNTDQRLIQLNDQVSWCVSGSKNVLPVGAFLLSGRWSVAEVTPSQNIPAEMSTLPGNTQVITAFSSAAPSRGK